MAGVCPAGILHGKSDPVGLSGFVGPYSADMKGLGVASEICRRARLLAITGEIRGSPARELTAAAATALVKMLQCIVPGVLTEMRPAACYLYFLALSSAFAVFNVSEARNKKRHGECGRGLEKLGRK